MLTFAETCRYFRLPERVPYPMDSREGLSWLFTHSIGGILVNRSADKDDEVCKAFVVDTRAMFDGVEMRENHIPLGVLVEIRLKEDGELLIHSIEYDGVVVHPGQNGFERFARIVGEFWL